MFLLKYFSLSFDYIIEFIFIFYIQYGGDKTCVFYFHDSNYYIKFQDKLLEYFYFNL